MKKDISDEKKLLSTLDSASWAKYNADLYSSLSEKLKTMGTSLEELYPDLGNKIKAFTDDVTKLKTTKLSNVSGYTN